jgi:hypothetical protein
MSGGCEGKNRLLTPTDYAIQADDNFGADWNSFPKMPDTDKIAATHANRDAPLWPTTPKP